MTTSNLSRVVGLVAGFAWLFGIRGVAMGQASAPATQVASLQLPQVIRDALLHNASQIGPTITAEWVTRTTSRYSEEEYAKVTRLDPGIAARVFNIWHYRAVRQDGRYFQSDVFEPRPAQQVRVNEFSVAEGFMYGGMKPARGKSSYSKRPLSNLPDQTSPVGAATYFKNIGLPLPTRPVDFQPHGTCIPEILAMLDQGVKLTAVDGAQLEGRKLVQLTMIGEDPQRRSADQTDLAKLEESLRRSASSAQYIQDILQGVKQARQLPQQRIYVLYLDPQLNYMIRRREQRYEGDILLSRLDCDDFRKLPGRDLVLPYICTESKYTESLIPGTYFKEPISVQTCEVETMSTERAGDETFVLHYTEPGTTFMDETEPQPRISVVQEDGTLLQIQPRPGR